ncbi:EF-hand domain pair [Ceraceosorus bombacis]|uniref:EF-hand domain pair n=1 Tax=Ceraceosorus bombacis TaxID=401625 RepID=A0A0P1BJ71_9BASI|nr:EF-hand domain pair [Ceraceosorus bombacis]
MASRPTDASAIAPTSGEEDDYSQPIDIKARIAAFGGGSTGSASSAGRATSQAVPFASGGSLSPPSSRSHGATWNGAGRAGIRSAQSAGGEVARGLSRTINASSASPSASSSTLSEFGVPVREGHTSVSPLMQNATPHKAPEYFAGNTLSPSSSRSLVQEAADWNLAANKDTGPSLRKTGSGVSLRELGARSADPAWTVQHSRVRSNSSASSSSAPSVGGNGVNRSHTDSPRLGVRNIIALYGNGAATRPECESALTYDSGTTTSTLETNLRTAVADELPASRHMLDGSEDTNPQLALHPSLRPSPSSSYSVTRSSSPAAANKEQSDGVKRAPIPPPRPSKTAEVSTGGASTPPARVTVHPPSPSKGSPAPHMPPSLPPRKLGTSNASEYDLKSTSSPTSFVFGTSAPPHQGSEFMPGQDSRRPSVPPRPGASGPPSRGHSDPNAKAPEWQTPGEAHAALGYKARAVPPAGALARGRGLHQAPAWASSSTGSLGSSPSPSDSKPPTERRPAPPPRPGHASTTPAAVSPALRSTSPKIAAGRHSRTGGSDPAGLRGPTSITITSTNNATSHNVSLSDAAADDLRAGLSSTLSKDDVKDDLLSSSAPSNHALPLPPRRTAALASASPGPQVHSAWGARSNNSSPAPGSVSSISSSSKASPPALPHLGLAQPPPPPRHFETRAAPGAAGGTRWDTIVPMQQDAVLQRANKGKKYLCETCDTEARARYEEVWERQVSKEEGLRARRQRSGLSFHDDVPEKRGRRLQETSDSTVRNSSLDVRNGQGVEAEARHLSRKACARIWTRSKLPDDFLAKVWDAAVAGAPTSEGLDKLAFVKAMAAIDTELARKKKNQRNRM